MKPSKIIESVINSLKQNVSGLEAIYLFGSQSDGSANRQSDWDVGFLTRSKIDATKRWKLKTAIESDLDIQLDLIDLYEADTVLQFQVVKSGTCIWCRDQLTCDEFEARTISFYQKLNLERAAIIEDISRRGNIYG